MPRTSLRTQAKIQPMYSPPIEGRDGISVLNARDYCRIGKAGTCSGRDLFVVSNHLITNDSDVVSGSAPAQGDLGRRNDVRGEIYRSCMAAVVSAVPPSEAVKLVKP